jgi:hypothetical protein
MSTLAASTEGRLEQLEARLHELEDKQALASLLNGYSLAVDSFDWDAWGRCWAEDAVADFGPYGKLEGREAIVANGRRAQDVYKARGGMQHVLANLEFELDGDTASGFGNLVFSCSLNSAKSPPDYAITGKYRWKFVRAGDGWQIQHAWLRNVWGAGPDATGIYG